MEDNQETAQMNPGFTGFEGLDGLEGVEIKRYSSDQEKVVAEAEKGDLLLEKWGKILGLSEPEATGDILNKEYRKRMKKFGEG